MTLSQQNRSSHQCEHFLILGSRFDWLAVLLLRCPHYCCMELHGVGYLWWCVLCGSGKKAARNNEEEWNWIDEKMGGTAVECGRWTQSCSERKIKMSDFGKEGNYGRMIIWFWGTFRRQEACTLDHIFVNVGVRSSVSGGLGWLLEHSAAPATWPSWCRWTCEGLDLSRNLIFDEHFVVRKLVLSGNFYSLHLDEQFAIGKGVIVGILMNVRGKRWLLWILFCWFVWI